MIAIFDILEKITIIIKTEYFCFTVSSTGQRFIDISRFIIRRKILEKQTDDYCVLFWEHFLFDFEEYLMDFLYIILPPLNC